MGLCQRLTHFKHEVHYPTLSLSDEKAAVLVQETKGITCLRINFTEFLLHILPPIYLHFNFQVGM
jgi:hypothetical protein